MHRQLISPVETTIHMAKGTTMYKWTATSIWNTHQVNAWGHLSCLKMC